MNYAAQGDNEPEAGAGDPSAEVNKDTKQTGAEASNSGNNSQAKRPPGADLQSFVERLTFSLYRAAAKELVESLRALPESLRPLPRNRTMGRLQSWAHNSPWNWMVQPISAESGCCMSVWAHS